MLLTRKLAHTFSDIPPETSYIPTESKFYQPVVTIITLNIYTKTVQSPWGCDTPSVQTHILCSQVTKSGELYIPGALQVLAPHLLSV